MGLWRGHLGGDRVGWDSPVGDGPVNPAFVNLMNWGGLGWLEGFDELLARCGLENNGAPYEEKVINPDGSERHTNLRAAWQDRQHPASFVAVHVDTEPPYEIVVEGRVEESRLFGPQIRMTTRVSTTPGSNRLTVRDEFLNLKDAPGEMQVLYHWNFGPPYLEEGSRFVAPVKVMAPRDAWAAAGIDHYETYRAPEPGLAEQCYFFEFQASLTDGRTLTMLRNKGGRQGSRAPVLPRPTSVFTLWKCTGGLKEGYVTGLEPGTNFPNPKPFEKARQRVVALPAHGRYVAETTLEVLSTGQAVAAVEAEIQAIQAQVNPTIHRKTTEPYGPPD